MMKHIGKHDQRKAVVLWREVPNDDNEMCLITYPDSLPALFHDPLMKCIESEVGQNAHDITEPLNRTLMDSGRNLLQALHAEGYIRRVPQNQMILQPNAATTIRLDELNRILRQMAEGKEATDKMRDLDSQAGFRDPVKNPKAQVAEATKAPVVTAAPIVAAQDGVLTDANIAQGQLSQADAMATNAEQLLAEAANLREEAYALAPELKPKATRKKAAPKKKATTTTAKRKPGRPRKNAAASAKN